MEKDTNVEESGEASRRDDVCRDGRRVASPARRRSRYGRRGDTVSNTVEEQCTILTKFDSTLTCWNSKFHVAI